MTDNIKKVVLAYSGGLDTSIILKWLQDEYHCEIVTFTADIGQGEELEPARAKAQTFGIKEIFIKDLREEFVQEYVFPMFARYQAQLGNAYMPSSAWRRSRPSRVSKADATKPCLVANKTRKAELC
jgi:argininosuccinate synthase